jgi:hypothetical protein
MRQTAGMVDSTGLRTVLRVPGVPRLLTAQMFTVFGDTALILTLAVWVENRTGNSSAASMTVFAFAAGVVVAPSAGRLVARREPRRMMASANLAATGVVLALLLAARGPFWLVYPLSMLYAFTGSISAGVLVGHLRAVVPEPLRVPVNAEFQSLHQLLRLMSPVAGVWLLGTGGITLVVLVVAGSLVLGAVLILLGPGAGVPPEPSRRGRGGYGLLRSDPDLRRISLLVIAASAAQGFAQTLGFLVIQDSLHRTADFIAVFVTIQSVAGLLSTRIGVIRRIARPELLVRIGLLLAGAGYAVLLLPGLWPPLAAFVLVGAGLPWIRIGFTSALQRHDATSGVALAGLSLQSLVQTTFIAAGALLGLLADWRILATAMVAVLLCAAGPGVRRRRSGGP